MSEPIPITVRGVTYPSCYAASKQLGVSPALVAYYRNQGREDEIGLFPPVHDGDSKSVTIRGKTYKSYTAAAKALNVSIGAVSKAVSRGRADTIGTKDVLG